MLYTIFTLTRLLDTNYVSKVITGVTRWDGPENFSYLICHPEPVEGSMDKEILKQIPPN